MKARFLYWLGDLVSKPMLKWDWPLYRVYRWLMLASVDADPGCAVWKKVCRICGSTECAGHDNKK